MKSKFIRDALAVEGSCSFNYHKKTPACSLGKFLIYLASVTVLLGTLCYVYMYGFSLRSKTNAKAVCCPPNTLSDNIPQVAVSSGSIIVKKPQNNGRFVYMVTGEREPNPRWRRLSDEEGVHIIFVAWKYGFPRPFISDKVRIFYYPKSTWTSCRNFLLQRAKELEEELGVKFDYYLFADEDVLLCSRSTLMPNDWSKDPLSSALVLHKNLIRDKPARASVEYSGRNINEFGLWCVRSCAFDGALDIYHRSVVPYLLPYFETFDEFSWQMSQYMTNLRSQALLEDFCYIYRDVFVNPMGNEHSVYPTDYDLLANATVMVSDCLAKQGIPLTVRPEESQDEARTRAIHRPKPELHTAPCTPQRTDIDYSEIFEEVLRAWPLNCSYNGTS